MLEGFSMDELIARWNCWSEARRWYYFFSFLVKLYKLTWWDAVLLAGVVTLIFLIFF